MSHVVAECSKQHVQCRVVSLGMFKSSVTVSFKFAGEGAGQKRRKGLSFFFIPWMGGESTIFSVPWIGDRVGSKVCVCKPLGPYGGMCPTLNYLPLSA